MNDTELKTKQPYTTTAFFKRWLCPGRLASLPVASPLFFKLVLKVELMVLS